MRPLGRSGSLPLSLVLVILAGPADAGQGPGRGLLLPSAPARPVWAHQDGEQRATPRATPRFLEVAFGDDAFSAGYRSATRSGELLRHDYFEIGASVNDDDDFELMTRLVRQGQIEDRPLRLGVGLGAYAVFVDETDERVWAVGLIGVCEYDLVSSFPTTLSADLAVAPDISTFDDGERLLELKVRLNVELNRYANAFVGIRKLEIDTDTDDFDFEDGLQFGVRLAL